MSLRSKDVRSQKKRVSFRVWWAAHWTDFLSLLALTIFVFGLVFGLATAELALYRSDNLVLQALALALMVGEVAGVVWMAVKE